MPTTSRLIVPCHVCITTTFPEIILVCLHKRKVSRVPVCLNSDDLRTTLHVAQFDRIFELFHDIDKMGAKSDDKCEVVMRGISVEREN